ncbi:MAG: arylsulfatase, partial [Pirellulaceae bacterium]
MQRFVIVLIAVAALAVASRSWAQSPPNVVLVITDDQGYGDLSCHGNPVLKTPCLDQLHAESVRLTDYHVSPTCSPTRSALMTGHWTNRTGVWHTILGRSLLRADEVTMGDVFAESGYATGMFGKWHLGDNVPYRAEDRGFQHVMRHGGGGVGQTPDYWNNAYFDDTYFLDGEPTATEGFCTDVWFDYAKEFIREQKKAGKPFFAYIATNAPHGPMHAPPSCSEPYQDLGTQVANFLGMIANIDENVGKLRSMLKAEGLEQNTIFIFTTDNGTAAGNGVFNSGMRGKKGSEYDGGHRVPFFIYWPDGKLNGGQDVTELTAHVDILPTLIDLCHLDSPADVRFDGRSIRPLLYNQASRSDGTWPDRILVTDSQRVLHPIKWRKSAVMTERWRLVNQNQLYDINADPAQKNNVAAEHPRVVKRLRNFYEAWWEELEPTFSRDCPIHLGHPAENPATLTCHDWLAPRMTPWNQSAIRKAVARPDATGPWKVKVVADGQYEIRLRRWPRETGAAIDASLPPASDVPGVRAWRTEPG